MLAGCTAFASQHRGLHVDAAVSPPSPTYYSSTPPSPTYYCSRLPLFQHAHHLLEQHDKSFSSGQNAFSMDMSVCFPQEVEKQESLEKTNLRCELAGPPKFSSSASADVVTLFHQIPSKTSHTLRYNVPPLNSEASAIQPQFAIQNAGQNNSMLCRVNTQPSVDPCLLEEIQGIGRAVEGFGDCLWGGTNFSDGDGRGKDSDQLSQLRQDLEGNIYWDNGAQNSPCSCTRQEESAPWPHTMGSNSLVIPEGILDGSWPMQDSGNAAATSTSQTSMSSAQLMLPSGVGAVVTRTCCSPSSSSAAIVRSTGDSSPSSPLAPWQLQHDSPSPAADKKMMQQHRQLIANEPCSVLDLAISPTLPPRASHFHSRNGLEDFSAADILPNRLLKSRRNLWFTESSKQFPSLPASLLPLPRHLGTSSVICPAGSAGLDEMLSLETDHFSCLPSHPMSEYVSAPAQAIVGGNSDDSERPVGGSAVEKILLGENPPVVNDREGRPVEEGVELINLLVACVEAISAGSLTFINQLLAQLGMLASPNGSAVQRLVAYFTEGLACRVAKQWPHIYQSPPMETDSNDDEESAWQVLNHATPLVKFAHYTANDIILEAFEGEERVHVIDLDIKQGLQWPALFQSLATRAGGAPKHVRVTGVGECREDVQDAGDRLAEFAEEFGLNFQFHSVVDKIEDVRLWMLHVKEKEAVAVNCILQLHRTLYDNTQPGGAARNVLSLIHSTRPKVVALVEQETDCHDQLSLEARFVAALRHFAALFDALDASALPPISPARLKADALFARYIRNILACDGPLRSERYQPLRRWHNLLAPAGFRCLSLSQRAHQQAHILLRMFHSPCPSSSGYRLLPDAPLPLQHPPQTQVSNEKLSFLTLAWSEEPLFTASAWAPT